MLNKMEAIENTSKLLRLMPFLNISILVKKNDLLNENTWSRYHGYSIELSNKPSYNISNETLETYGFMKKIPSKKCIYTIQSFNLTKESKLNSIRLIKLFLEKNNHTMDGDMFGNQLFVDNEMNISRKNPIGEVYYEYWIPIK